MRLALLTLALGRLQNAPPAPAPPPVRSAADLAREEGHKALVAGERDRAQRLLLRALWLDPASADALRDLAANAADEESRRLRSFAFADAAADENGGLKLDAASRKVLGSDAPYRSLPIARAELAKEIARAAARLGPADAPSLARWLAEIGREVMRRQPSLERKHAAALDSALARTAPRDEAVIGALTAAIEAAFARGSADDALRAARILLGFATQAGFKDLASPAPDLKSARATAAKAIDRARQALRAKESEPWTIERLAELDPTARRAFTREHSDPAQPGVAVSPGGLYRLESTCGFETLLAATRQVELHHERLAKWVGSDPFAGRPGLVRVFPEFDELESEGVPFWWAGGFQSGDVTTLHFSHGTPGQLGRGLTHELTHRFDGALHPGMPAWLAEGRAVWTAGAYGNISDEELVDKYVNSGAVAEAYRKGINVESLTKLIDGTIADYRDNYTSGHALWVYLWGWDPDKKIFRSRIPKYLAGLKTAAKPTAWFAECFADGKEGRPKSLDLFAKGLEEFGRGFWWESRAEWSRHYVERVPSTENDPLLFDAPTWTLERQRAEPCFGQDHATEAGLLLARLGSAPGAIAGLEWALERDETSPEVGALLAGLYEKASRADAAWAVRLRMHLLRPGVIPAPPAYPGGILGGVLSRVGDMLRAESEATLARESAGDLRLAAALRADRDRLAFLAGREVAASRPASAPAAASDGAPPPADFCEPEHVAGVSGYVEDRLTGFEEYRVPGLWHASPSGDLVLGRRSGGPQTGIEREARLAQTYARGQEWLSGSYGLRVRVRALTAFVSGAVIVGHRRHDRQFRVTYALGDWGYAKGKTEEQRTPDHVRISFGDQRDREPILLGDQLDRVIKIPINRNSFDLEVLVDGPVVHVFVDGELRGSHHAATGLPVEGYVGFASADGVVQLESPTVRRHRLLPSGERCLCKPWPIGLDPAREQEEPWEGIAGNCVRNLPIAGEPVAFLWFPDITRLSIPDPDFATQAPIDFGKHFLFLRRHEDLESLPAVFALPETLTPEQEAKVRAGLEKGLGPRDVIIHHKAHRGYERTKQEMDALLAPYLFFVDAVGVARTQEPLRRAQGFPPEFDRWMRVLGRR